MSCRGNHRQWPDFRQTAHRNAIESRLQKIERKLSLNDGRGSFTILRDTGAFKKLETGSLVERSDNERAV